MKSGKYFTLNKNKDDITKYVHQLLKSDMF